MKALLSIPFLLITVAIANATECNLEAEIRATVTEVRTDSMSFCKAYVAYESISLYTPHNREECRLHSQEVIRDGIEFPLVDGHDCEIRIGQKIEGYLVKKNGRIYLD